MNIIESGHIRGVTTVALSSLAYLFGSFDGLLVALLAMMAIDFITGILKAIVTKELASRGLLIGAVRKIGMLAIVAVANILDNTFDINAILRSVTIAYFITGEALSILENWGQMGLPVPSGLKKVLKQLKD